MIAPIPFPTLILALSALPALVSAQSDSTSTTGSTSASATTATATATTSMISTLNPNPGSSSTTPTSTTTSALASSTLAIDQGSKSYAYVGCWNETTSYAQGGFVRALSGGTMEGDDGLTPERCFAFCRGERYAGLEYGRECWCAPYLSSLSTVLPAERCDIPCKGEAGTACGGSLTLSLYNLSRDDASTNGAGTGGGGPAAQRAAWSSLGVASLVVLGVVVAEGW